MKKLKQTKLKRDSLEYNYKLYFPTPGVYLVTETKGCRGFSVVSRIDDGQDLYPFSKMALSHAALVHILDDIESVAKVETGVYCDKTKELKSWQMPSKHDCAKKILRRLATLDVPTTCAVTSHYLAGGHHVFTYKNTEIARSETVSVAGGLAVGGYMYRLTTLSPEYCFGKWTSHRFHTPDALEQYVSHLVKRRHLLDQNSLLINEIEETMQKTETAENPPQNDPH